MVYLKWSVLIGLILASAWTRADSSLESSAWGKAGRIAGIPSRSLYEMACQKSCTVWPDGSLRPWPWVLHRNGKKAFYKDKSSASAALKELMKYSGFSGIGVGIMQVEIGQFKRYYNNPPEQLFDPGLNLMAAATLLKQPLTSPRLLQVTNRKVGLSYLIHTTAVRHQIDEQLLHAVIKTESGYNPSAVSRAGAVGLMQLMPDTARRFGVSNRIDPVQNVNGGTRYLKFLLRRYNGNVPLSVAAYNAGEKAVDKYGGIPPYRETQGYVASVMASYQRRYHPVPPA